jgi:hypothetical protein
LIQPEDKGVPAAVKDILEAESTSARGVLKKAGRGCWALKENIGLYCAHLRKLVARGEGTPAEAKGRLAYAQAEGGGTAGKPSRPQGDSILDHIADR